LLAKGKVTFTDNKVSDIALAKTASTKYKDLSKTPLMATGQPF